MTIANLGMTLFERLKQKGIVVALLFLAAIVLAGVVSFLIHLVLPVVPPPYQRIVGYLQHGDWAASRTALKQVLESYGTAQAGVFLAAQVLQVLIAPVPGQLLGFLGGYLFGFWQGLGLSMVGLLIGSEIAIGLSRMFGDFIVRKLAPQSVVTRFDYLIEDGGLWNFFVLFLLPGVPDDALCLIAGLTRIPIWKLILVCGLGRLPGMAVLSFVGSGIDRSGSGAYIVLGVAMMAAGILWLFSPEVEASVARMHGDRKAHEAVC